MPQDDKELDIDKLRRVQEAAARYYHPNKIFAPHAEYMDTFNPSLVGRLLDLGEENKRLREALEWSAGSGCSREFKHDGNPPCGTPNEKGRRVYCHPCHARAALAQIGRHES